MQKIRLISLIKRLTVQQSFCALFALFFMAGLTACSRYFNDANHDSAHMQVQGGLSCLNQASETLSDYVAGKVPLAQMDALLDCTSKSVDEFTQKVTGSSGQPGTYNQNDIAIFLDDYLLTSGKFDHQLLATLFDLKAASIGGDDKSISPSDIAKLKSLLTDIKTSLGEVDPYLGLLTRREKIDPHSTTDQNRYELAEAAFRSAIARILPYFAPSSMRQQTFTVDEGFNLLSSLGIDMTKYESYEDLTRISKQMIVGGAIDTISADEWFVLAQRAVDGYAIYLRYETFVDSLPLTDPVVTPQLHTIVNQGTDFLNQAMTRQSGQVLTEAQLQQLVTALASANLMPKALTAASVNAFIPIVVEKWLLNRTVANPVSSHGIGLPEFSLVSYYAQNWLDGMDVLGDVVPQATITQDQLHAALQRETAKPPLSSEVASDLARKQTVMSEWNQIFSQGRPWGWDSRNYIVIAPPAQLPVITRDQVFRMNIFRLIDEAVLKTYAQDPQRAQAMTGLTSDEVQQVYMDIRGISYDLGLIDPRNFGAGSRTFMEMNLFTSAANGDSYAQYREAIDWFGSAISATEQATALYKDIGQRCAPTAQNDLLGNRQMDEACFRAELRKGFTGYFTNFPNLITFYNQRLQDDASWNAFIVALEIVARPQGSAPGPIDLGSVRTLVTVMGYNESLFLRFDADQNQLLSDDELWTAFPLVQPLIQSAMAKAPVVPFVRGACTVAAPVAPPAASPYWLQQAVFAYLIQNGHPPPTSGIGLLGLPFAYAKSYVLNANLTRLDLIKIIASFTTVANQKNLDAITAFYQSQQATLRGDLESGVCSTVVRTLNLFQCDPSATAAMVAFSRAHDATIFAGGASETPAQFTQAMEQQLQNDSAMRGVCMPF